MINSLIIGMILGLSAGVAPGPLLALVVAETLQRDIRSGIRIALAPLITDLPIILISLFILANLADFHAALGGISLAGGLFLLFLGYQSLKIPDINPAIQGGGMKSLTKGILTNFLSPHPYLFWLTIGAPMMIKAMNSHRLAGLAFIGSFYFCLIGAKILLAIVVGKSRFFLTGGIYRAIIRCLGLFLIILAGKLLYDGLKLLQILT